MARFHECAFIFGHGSHLLHNALQAALEQRRSGTGNCLSYSLNYPGPSENTPPNAAVSSYIPASRQDIPQCPRFIMNQPRQRKQYQRATRQRMQIRRTCRISENDGATAAFEIILALRKTLQPCPCPLPNSSRYLEGQRATARIVCVPNTDVISARETGQIFPTLFCFQPPLSLQLSRLGFSSTSTLDATLSHEQRRLRLQIIYML
ncbi:uncharacterized protein BT62DRAFT_643688 [Guyanagaster necrorhizus]|uniref:Uncharacterized protein n=1 Tax=Guyanagaster necrorhizus TaxID=856835 RepID=A0A9P7VFP8_9AGAR|nr:uncharacterized protein BT62DRAFT_643688 [Guyanagaster necrorhizus MCA 3950]KAG7440083.1 hypothetical protein BT62DRAFT_643688 [Guyanagaster necrorhizus MCA 3950]